LVVAFHDPQVLNRFAERYPLAIYERHGSNLNIPKSAITGREVDIWEGPPEGWKINYEGPKALAAYAGESGWTKILRNAKIKSLKPPTESLQKLKLSSQTYLLNLVISARAQYTVGAAPTVESVLPTAISFDDSIQRAYNKAVEILFTETVKTLLALPKVNAGLRLMQEWMAVNHPGKLQQTRNPDINAEIILGTVEGLVEATEIEPNRWGAVIEKEVRHSYPNRIFGY
jgi:hypothetical protein